MLWIELPARALFQVLTTTFSWRLHSEECDAVTSPKQERDSCGFSKFSTQNDWDAKIRVHVYRKLAMALELKR
jgi:hypothetical protein